MKQYVGVGYTVYKHTNLINGKAYIGQTKCQDLTRRWTGGNGYRQSPHFNRAIQKYGWSGFAHEILETGLTQKEANEKERYYIALYKTTDQRYGYNIQSGGQHAGELSKEGRESIRKHSTGANSPVSRKVDIYDSNGKLIKTFDAMSEAAKYIGVGCPYLTAVCKRQSGTAKGYICHYHDYTKGTGQLPIEMIYKVGEVRKHYKKAAQYSADGELIKIYPSIKAAAEATGVLRTEITTCITHPEERIGAGGYMWRSGDDAPQQIKPMPFEPHAEGVHLYSKAVVRREKSTGKTTEYSSVKNAAHENNVASTTIIRAIKGIGKIARNYAWQYKY